MSVPPPPPARLPEGHQYTCRWCGISSSGTGLTCPACGAAVDLHAVITPAGWVELPPIADMARLQFGQSTCQIEGTYVPVADINLAAGDSVYFTHHVLLWQDPSVTIRAMSLRGGWKRLMAGLPLIMTEAHGPGHIAFSQDRPGELIALPLQHGQAVDVREHVFMVATGQIAYDWFTTGVWFTTGSGNDKETHYPLGQYMDRFSAAGAPGLLLLHGGGNVFVRRLNQGETILVKPTALLFKDPAVGMQLHIERPANTARSWRAWGERYLWLHLSGPGRVAIESDFPHFHDPGLAMSRSSPATYRQWR